MVIDFIGMHVQTFLDIRILSTYLNVLLIFLLMYQVATA